MAWLSGYTTRRKLTIDQTKVDADLSDFPILVKLASGNFDFSHANSDGYDIRFTSSDGTTLLKYERLRHDSANQAAEYWVKVPSVSGTVNTDIYLYYSTTDTADGADRANVWDANFKYVHHLNALSGENFTDSTGHGFTATRNGTGVTTVAGKISQGVELARASTERISIGSVGNLTAFTIELWFLPNQPEMSGMWGSDFGYGSPEWTKPAGFTGAYQQVGLQFPTGTAEPYTLNKVGNDAAFTEDQWNYGAGTYSGTQASCYSNGSEVTGSPVSASGTCTGWAGTHYIGYGGYHWSANEEYFDGVIEEVRLSTVARSAAWIKASYNAGNNSLLSYGAEEGSSQGYSLTGSVGSFSLSGKATGFKKGLNLPSGRGSFILTGWSANLTRLFILMGGRGIFTTSLADAMLGIAVAFSPVAIPVGIIANGMRPRLQFRGVDLNGDQVEFEIQMDRSPQFNTASLINQHSETDAGFFPAEHPYTTSTGN